MGVEVGGEHEDDVRDVATILPLELERVKEEDEEHMAKREREGQ